MVRTRVKVAEEIETTKAYVNRVIKKPEGVANRTFVRMMEAPAREIMNQPELKLYL